MLWYVEYALAITLFAFLCYASLKRRNQSKWEKIGYLKSIDLYPLKGGAKLTVDSAFCASVGLVQTGDESDTPLLRDRCFVIYAEHNNEFRSARQLPRTLLIKVTPYCPRTVALDAPDTKRFLLELPNASVPNATVRMLAGECVETTDCGDDVARWLSRFLLQEECGLRLGYNDGSLARNLELNWSDLIQHDTLLSSKAAGLYAKLVSVSVTNQMSIDDCNDNLAGVVKVTAANFRHNLLIDGPGLKAFDEDRWDCISIGRAVKLRKVKDCLRCAVPGLDPQTAKKIRPRGTNQNT
ncbi:mitochondrial amidoxime-reducing component 1-like [Cylas formicarius]|uniref:mitochondrial amidoxime-reducing component 1-like n=1 Tax=Cylas formicarius TaxID=197179 RepID=UPI0029585B79|nr:mitochondrial amidoxime-reducing component 1-like [Cylas formicarius]